MTESKAPAGDKISIKDGDLQVGDHPIIPFIEGDGTGPDIWRSAVNVFDSAVELAYGGKKKIAWYEVLAGQKAFDKTGSWLPEETVEAFKEYLVGIKGPLTTPIGGGIRSLNVALRQRLDLYTCLRPVRWFNGVPSPVRDPGSVNMVIFRENTEDIYAGVEFEESARTDDAKKFIALPARSTSRSADAEDPLPGDQRHRHQARLAQEGTERLVRARDQLRAGARTQERHPRSQGQHHEVHRGRVHEVGL